MVLLLKFVTKPNLLITFRNHDTYMVYDASYKRERILLPPVTICSQAALPERIVDARSLWLPLAVGSFGCAGGLSLDFGFSSPWAPRALVILLARRQRSWIQCRATGKRAAGTLCFVLLLWQTPTTTTTSQGTPTQVLLPPLLLVVQRFTGERRSASTRNGRCERRRKLWILLAAISVGGDVRLQRDAASAATP